MIRYRGMASRSGQIPRDTYSGLYEWLSISSPPDSGSPIKWWSGTHSHEWCNSICLWSCYGRYHGELSKWGCKCDGSRGASTAYGWERENIKTKLTWFLYFPCLFIFYWFLHLPQAISPNFSAFSHSISRSGFTFIRIYSSIVVFNSLTFIA